MFPNVPPNEWNSNPVLANPELTTVKLKSMFDLVKLYTNIDFSELFSDVHWEDTDLGKTWKYKFFPSEGFILGSAFQGEDGRCSREQYVDQILQGPIPNAEEGTEDYERWNNAFEDMSEFPCPGQIVYQLVPSKEGCLPVLANQAFKHLRDMTEKVAAADPPDAAKFLSEKLPALSDVGYLKKAKPTQTVSTKQSNWNDLSDQSQYDSLWNKISTGTNVTTRHLKALKRNVSWMYREDPPRSEESTGTEGEEGDGKPAAVPTPGLYTFLILEMGLGVGLK